MEKLTLLIADSSSEFTASLSRELEDCFRIYSCSSGIQALELCRSLQPQVLALDLSLPRMDGLTLLRTLRTEGFQGYVLASSCLLSDYEQQKLRELQVSYAVLRPCLAQSFADRARDFCGSGADALPPIEGIQAQIRRILLELGLNPRHQGFPLVLLSIEYAASHPGAQMTKEVYPAVARLQGGNGGQVERAIRSAMGWGWDRRQKEAWARYFPLVHSDVPRPTNTTFILTLARHIGLQPEK